MTDEIRKNLFDIRESIYSIETYLGEKRDFNIYIKNKMLRRAIEREFEIIGEAMNRIDKLDSSVEISSKFQIIGMRNVFVHEYFGIDLDLVWEIIKCDLPELKMKIAEIHNSIS